MSTANTSITTGSHARAAVGPQARAEADADERESRFRLAMGAAIALMLATAAFGLAWDIRWHIVVGRDTFFSPPHLFLYAGVALAGVLALAMVLVETSRYHRGSPAVNDDTTTQVFGYFHAPLGFVVAGFGLLTMLLAAPLDNYWHELYGIDVALWTPFHMMGLVGGLIAGLGVIYGFASEVARGRAAGRYRLRLLGFTGTELGTVISMGMLLGLLMVAAWPATNQFPTTWIGRFEFLSYPVLLSLFVPALGVAALAVTRRPGAASLVLLAYALRQALFTSVVPYAVWSQVSDPSVLRMPGWRPAINGAEVLQPFFFIVPMLLIDLLYAAWKRRGREGAPTWIWTFGAGVLAALPILYIAPMLTRNVLTAARSMNLPPSIIIGNLPATEALWNAVPVALGMAVLSAIAGLGWGRFLRVYDR